MFGRSTRWRTAIAISCSSRRRARFSDVLVGSWQISALTRPGGQLFLGLHTYVGDRDSCRRRGGPIPSWTLQPFILPGWLSEELNTHMWSDMEAVGLVYWNCHEDGKSCSKSELTRLGVYLHVRGTEGRTIHHTQHLLSMDNVSRSSWGEIRVEHRHESGGALLRRQRTPISQAQGTYIIDTVPIACVALKKSGWVFSQRRTQGQDLLTIFRGPVVPARRDHQFENTHDRR